MGGARAIENAMIEETTNMSLRTVCEDQSVYASDDIDGGETNGHGPNRVTMDSSVGPRSPDSLGSVDLQDHVVHSVPR
jgi:hypothetical protein